jgi:hypothetical protein
MTTESQHTKVKVKLELVVETDKSRTEPQKKVLEVKPMPKGGIENGSFGTTNMGQLLAFRQLMTRMNHKTMTNRQVKLFSDAYSSVSEF